MLFAVSGLDYRPVPLLNVWSCTQKSSLALCLADSRNDDRLPHHKSYENQVVDLKYYLSIFMSSLKHRLSSIESLACKA